MSLFGRILGGLFGGGGSSRPTDNANYYYVKCSRCEEKIRVRIDKGNDLAQEYEDGGDNPSGYTATKGIVGKKCFRVLNLSVKFDRNRRESSRSVEGGEFITEEEFTEA